MNQYLLTNHLPLSHGMLYIQDGCDLNCENCIVAGGLIAKRSASIRKVIKALKWYYWANYNEPLKGIALTGGNVLLHKNLFKIIDLCHKIHTNCAVTLMVNGSNYRLQDDDFWAQLESRKTFCSLKIRPYYREISDKWIKKANQLKIYIGGQGHDYDNEVEFFRIKLADNSNPFLSWKNCRDYRHCGFVNCIHDFYSKCGIPTLCYNLNKKEYVKEDDVFKLKKDRKIFDSYVPHMCSKCVSLGTFKPNNNNKKENYEIR